MHHSRYMHGGCEDSNCYATAVAISLDLGPTRVTSLQSRGREKGKGTLYHTYSQVITGTG